MAAFLRRLIREAWENYAHLGDMHEAFRCLERTYEERAAWLFVPGAPSFDIFRDDPRFEAIAARIGSPDAES